jgi:hypothetical protein
LCVAVLGLGVTPASAAPQCVRPTGVYREPPTWAARLTDARSVWPLTTGVGQTVAVLGTGVDPRSPQFGPGRVLPGATDDCDGRGTFAAGIVAARPDPATTFVGMAPGVRILPVKYTETTENGGAPDPDRLAGAVSSAVGAGATVVLVVAPAMRNSPGLARAVRDAVARDVVVVSPAVGDKASARSYPTGLPGVLGVGAVGEGGGAVQGESGSHILISAPGKDVVGTSARTGGKVGHIWGLSSPPLYAAAAYVAGAVALVRAYRPELRASQVVQRVVSTASRPAGGLRDPRLGWGVLDVGAAVTASLGEAVAGRASVAPFVPAAAPPEPVVHRRLPGVLALAGVLLAVAAVVSVGVFRRGRARGWRAFPPGGPRRTG